MSHCAAQAMATGDGGAGSDPMISAPPPSLIGTTLDGTYLITRLIAEGGMSAVYEGQQLRLNQRVAVKVMARELACNQEALARFHREAEITSKLRHPHLVTVMDFGTAPAGQPYLVMEHLEGIDLEDRLRMADRMSVATVVQIVQQVASALAAAHEQGIVHRDLKPANVFLVQLPGEPDFAKVLDFGISKVRAAGTQLTKASAIMGTPNYMSPEQATGMLDDIDHRTDQWALACIAWEMLSGRAPFASDDISAVFYQVIHLDPQPLGKYAPELPAGVETVLRRALSKNIADRFPSTRDFASALASAAAGRRVSDGPTNESSGPDGVRVERRHSRQERRRSPGDPSGSSWASPNLPSGAQAMPLWRKVKPIHALTALALALGIAIGIPLRGQLSARVAALPVPTPAVGVATAAPEKLEDTRPPTAPLPAEKPVPVTEGAGGKAKQAALDPVPAHRRSSKLRGGKLARQVDDGDRDPFAPRAPASAPKPQRGHHADQEFVDPFGP